MARDDQFKSFQNRFSVFLKFTLLFLNHFSGIALWAYLPILFNFKVFRKLCQMISYLAIK